MGPSRRAVLLGGLLGVTGCGATTPLGPPSQTAARPQRIVEGAFYSPAARRSVGYAMIFPPGHEEGDRLPVVVTLHGRGGDHRTAIRRLHLDRVLDRVRAPFALVSVDGGDHSYYHPRVDGTDAGAMVVDELLPRLGDRGLDVSRVGLHGWSMGGYGALLLASRHPGRFRAVAVSSPALFAGPGASSAGSFDGERDFARHDVLHHPERLHLPVRLDCGLDDPFLATTRELAARLPAAVSAFPPGRHVPAYWQRMAGPAFGFLEAEVAR